MVAEDHPAGDCPVPQDAAAFRQRTCRKIDIEDLSGSGFLPDQLCENLVEKRVRDGMAAADVLGERDRVIALKRRLKGSARRCGILDIRRDIEAGIDAGEYNIRTLRHDVQPADAHAVRRRAAACKRMDARNRKIVRKYVDMPVQRDAVRSSAALTVRRDHPDLSESLRRLRQTDQPVCGNAVVICNQD